MSLTECGRTCTFTSKKGGVGVGTRGGGGGGSHHEFTNSSFVFHEPRNKYLPFDASQKYRS